MSEPLSAYWADAQANQFARFKSNPKGLTAIDAVQRLKTCGANRVSDQNAIGPLRLQMRQFENPLVLVLIFGAVLSLILQQWTDASIIIVIVVTSGSLENQDSQSRRRRWRKLEAFFYSLSNLKAGTSGGVRETKRPTK